MARTTTVRFENEAWADLELVARITGRSASDIVRAAIAAYIAELRNEPGFQTLIREMAEENRSRLSRIGRLK